MPRRQGEQDKGQVIEVRRIVNHGAVVIRRADPQAVVTPTQVDHSVQPRLGHGAPGLPAQGGGFAEYIDLARLNARTAAKARHRTAFEIQLLEKPPICADPAIRPQGQCVLKQPVGDPGFGDGKAGHAAGLGRNLSGAKGVGRCKGQREVRYSRLATAADLARRAATFAARAFGPPPPTLVESDPQ